MANPTSVLTKLQKISPKTILRIFHEVWAINSPKIDPDQNQNDFIKIKMNLCNQCSLQGSPTRKKLFLEISTYNPFRELL